AVQSYPYADSYTMWPGPNSNTFTAHVGREVPELIVGINGQRLLAHRTGAYAGADEIRFEIDPETGRPSAYPLRRAIAGALSPEASVCPWITTSAGAKVSMTLRTRFSNPNRFEFIHRYIAIHIRKWFTHVAC
ncbi:MAG: DUF3750 domain-containing protein, partial [Burkholderiaceae bacterium]|nr:DUF3750 domain-containing protein [Burkholderiaceae bacterium]